MLFEADRPLPENRGILLWLIGGIVVLLALTGVIWGIQNRYIHGGSLFGILGNSSPTASPLPLATGTALFTNTPAVAISDTATPQPPSLTPTLESTSSPTQTPTSSPSYTPTSTRKIMVIPTIVPTKTFVFLRNTPVPPTDVPPTDTPVPPTIAPTATSAPTATAPPT